MKQLFIALFFLLFLTTSSFSQIEKGKFLIRGGSGLGPSVESRKSPSGYKYWNLNANVKIGYFFVNNLAVGVSSYFGYNFSKSDSYRSRLTAFNLQPFVRYYFMMDKVGVFAEAAGGPSFFNSSTKYASPFIPEPYKSSSTLWDINGGLGVNYFVNENVAVEFLVNYYRYIAEPKNTNFKSSGALNAGLGFVILF